MSSPILWGPNNTSISLQNSVAVNNLLDGFSTTPTAAGTTVLTALSAQLQYFTGTTTQTITLPAPGTTVPVGRTFIIVNRSTGNLTVNSSGGNLVQTLIPNTQATITCILASGTTAVSWNTTYALTNSTSASSISLPIVDAPVAYTPTFTSFGTVSNVNFVSWRVGANLYIQGTFTIGASPTAVESQITLGYNGASGGVSTPATLPTLSICGKHNGNVNTTTTFGAGTILMEASKNYLTFGLEASTSNGMVKVLGSNAFSPSATISLFAIVPISGWLATTTVTLPSGVQISSGQINVPNVTDWTTYSLTIGATTTAPTLGTNTSSAQWRRVGDSMEIVYSYAQTATGSANSGSGSYLFPIPVGYTIDTTKITASTGGFQGTVGTATGAWASGGSTYTIHGDMVVYNTTNLAIQLEAQFNGSNGTINNANGFLQSGSLFIVTAANTNGSLTFTARVPIVGWTANSQVNVLGNLGAAPVNPSVQKFLSGSGVYTTPQGAQFLRVRMCGAGGGGGGGGSSAGAGGTGGNTTFGSSLLVANGGQGGVANGAGATTGGTASLGSGPIGTAVSGGSGTLGTGGPNSGTVSGGAGGNSALGGGAGGSLSAGAAGAANTGGGGAGGYVTTTSVTSGGGGSAGGYIDCIINSPGSTYSYSVGTAGTAGTAGTSGYAGGAGGSGYIEVTEFFANTTINSNTSVAANTIFGGPPTGVGATPTFRSLVNADLPSVVCARYTNTSTATVPTSSTTFNFATVDYDPFSAVTTGAGWVFTVPAGQAGKYEVNAYTSVGASVLTDYRIEIYKNGVSFTSKRESQQIAASVAMSLDITDTVNCVAGDTLAVRFWVGGQVASFVSPQAITITRVG